MRGPLEDCRRLGVEIRTGVGIGVAEVERVAPDVVILATGARPARPSWAGEVARVVDVRDVLDGSVPGMVVGQDLGITFDMENCERVGAAL